MWIPVIKEGDSSATDLLKHSWFFFDICVKSALQSLLSKKGLQKPRADRLPLNFTLNIRTLMDLLTMEIQKRSKLGHTIAKRLNQAVGYFLRDCLGFMDRGFIFSLIHRHADETKPNDSEVLLEFKLEFLRIICNYEHYVALNLPLVPKAYSDKMLTLSEEFCDRHFLAGLILRELAITLEHTEKTLRKRAIFMVRDLLAKFDSDDRYNDKEARARIAGLHFPLISIILENHKRLAINDGLSEKQLEGTESKSNNNTLSDAQAQAAQKELSGTSGRSSSLANALASPASVTQSGDGFDFEESRELLLCFLHILNDANPELVRFWWRSNKDFPSVLQSFFDVLEKSIMLFEYVGKRRLLARAS